MIRSSLAIGLCGVLSACAPDAPADATVIRSDSAGVKIIITSRPDTPLTWRLTDVGVLRDSVGEPWRFTQVTPARVLTDRAGRTYVLDTDLVVRRFARDGHYERAFGGTGDGPGEMQAASALLQQGDSLAAFDAGRAALVRWGPDLEAINDIALRGALGGVRQMAFRVGGVWVERVTRDSTGYTMSLYGDTLPGDPLLRVRHGTPEPLVACGGQVELIMPPFFSPEIHWETAGARMLASTGPAYDLRLYEGPRLIASIRRALPPRAPMVADLARLYPEGFTRQVAGRAPCTIPLAALQQQVGVAAWMPFVQGVSLLSDGTMWVQRSLPGESPVLDVFGSDGAYAGTVSGFGLPLGLLPNGELLVSRAMPDSGGFVVVRLTVRK